MLIFKTGHGRKYPPKRVILKEIVTTREESGEQNLAYLVAENSLEARLGSSYFDADDFEETSIWRGGLGNLALGHLAVCFVISSHETLNTPLFQDLIVSKLCLLDTS